MDPESRSGSKTANSSVGDFLRDVARYLASSVAIGHEEGLDPSGYNFTNIPDRGSSSESDAGQCGCDSNGSTSDDRDRRRDTQHSEGHAQEVSTNESGNVTVDPAVSSRRSACIEADPGHDVGDPTHGGRDAENNLRYSTSVEANTIYFGGFRHSDAEVTASGGQPVWHDGTHRWSNSGRTDGDPQVCVSTTATLVRQVHNQPGQTGNEDVNHPVTVDHNKVVWEWILEHHTKNRV